MAEASTPDFLRVLVAPPYRFDMAVRRGGASFFTNSNTASSILAERVRWLGETPSRYSACLPEAGLALQEAIETATGHNPAFAQFPGLMRGSLAERCVALGTVWEPDFLLLLPVVNDFRLVGGCVCFPSSWVPEEKFGHPLEGIHSVVPGLNQELGRKIQSFVESLKPGADWERVNWGIAATPELNLHPERGLPRLGAHASLATSWFRVEHQAFRRLPQSKGVLFVLRIQVASLAEACREPGFASTLRHLLTTMSQEVAEYKGLAACRDGLGQELARLAESQKPN